MQLLELIQHNKLQLFGLFSDVFLQLLANRDYRALFAVEPVAETFGICRWDSHTPDY